MGNIIKLNENGEKVKIAVKGSGSALSKEDIELLVKTEVSKLVELVYNDEQEKKKNEAKGSEEKVKEFEEIELSDGSVFNIEAVGRLDCPFCGAVINWDKVDFDEGGWLWSKAVSKDCPVCENRAYELDKKKKIWLAILPETEEEEE